MVKCLYIFTAIVSFLCPVSSMGQSADSLETTGKVNYHRQFPFRQQLVPLGLLAGGAVLETHGIRETIQDWFPSTHTTVEDYLRDGPVVMLYGSDLLGCEHRDNVINQTIYLIASRLTTGFLTGVLKRATHMQRPNLAGFDSFPSGHTSEAFTSATVFFRETIDYNPWLAYSGYTFAGATAVLRVTNNYHWVGDVLAGAGLGILVTNMVYYIDPLKNWDPLKLNRRVSVIPDIDPEYHTYCIGIIIPLDQDKHK